MNIGDFLQDFKKSIDKQFGYKDKIVDTIKNVSGVELNRDSLVLENRNLKIKTNAYEKTNILLHKQKILEDLKRVLPEKTINNIL